MHYNIWILALALSTINVVDFWHLKQTTAVHHVSNHLGKKDLYSK